MDITVNVLYNRYCKIIQLSEELISLQKSTVWDGSLGCKDSGIRNFTTVIIQKQSTFRRIGHMLRSVQRFECDMKGIGNVTLSDWRTQKQLTTQITKAQYLSNAFIYDKSLKYIKEQLDNLIKKHLPKIDCI